MPPATTTSEEALRVDRALDRGKQHLTPSELASAAPSILPPGMIIHKPLKEEEVYRILRNFAFDNTNNSSPLPQKPTPAQVSSALAKAEAERWINRTFLLSLSSNASKAFMALADSSQGGVVNKEHEFNAWSARDDPHFDLESWSGGNSSNPRIPASIDRAFDRADWTADQRRGINASAAERLGFGDRVNELFLTMDANGDGRLTLEELSERMPADTPLLASSSSSSAKQRHPIYAYTPENGKRLARALLRAFDADGDGEISKTQEGEAAAAVEALSALRAGEGTRSRAGRQLIAALVLEEKYGPSAALTEKEVIEYESRARQSGEMSVGPPRNEKGGDVAQWFEKSNGGKKSSSVGEFVALADKKKEDS